ncbi:MAG: Ig domain-containing protein, partial [Muribaculaceae bacterium]|nr:Ig domain-containing protein [Muribaculaceae bacterium]
MYIDGHKGARSGSETTKFKVNTSPYRWEILNSNFPKGRFHFDPILGSLYFESVDEVGVFNVTIKVTDKKGNSDTKVISWTVQEPIDGHHKYKIHDRIWWLLKEDNDISTEGK